MYDPEKREKERITRKLDSEIFAAEHPWETLSSDDIDHLRDVIGLDYQEIGDLYGRTANTVRHKKTAANHLAYEKAKEAAGLGGMSCKEMSDKFMQDLKKLDEEAKERLLGDVDELAKTLVCHIWRNTDLVEQAHIEGRVLDDELMCEINKMLVNNTALLLHIIKSGSWLAIEHLTDWAKNSTAGWDNPTVTKWEATKIAADAMMSPMVHARKMPDKLNLF